MDYATATSESIASAIGEEIGRDVDYRYVETDGAHIAAKLLAEMIATVCDNPRYRAAPDDGPTLVYTHRQWTSVDFHGRRPGSAQIEHPSTVVH